ncbi:MAG TPA: hypothetical protein VGG33_08750 [Polyangia bacterium]
MKNSNLKNLFVALVLTATSACASTSSTVTAPTLDSRLYTQEEVSRIIALRESGASLAQVASEVGGTRNDVRDLERAMRGNRGTLVQPSTSFSLAQK